MQFLPAAAGLLPKWLFFIGVTAMANSVQSYLTLHFIQQVYLNADVTPLQSRTFGTWTAVQGLIRIYAAFNIHDSNLYQLAFLVTVIAQLHFAVEWLVLGTARWGRGLASPVIVATFTIIWMWLQWDHYVS